MTYGIEILEKVKISANFIKPFLCKLIIPTKLTKRAFDTSLDVVREPENKFIVSSIS